MRCARCGRCCVDTMMELSEEDILRLSGLGHRRQDFCIVGADGIARLRNIKGRCFFLSQDGDVCIVYAQRPLGCDIYPVNCDQHGHVFVDDFCRAKSTVTEDELLAKGEMLRRHIAIIDKEVEGRKKRKR
jgi:Fe-S-cluster containining protein